MNPRMLKFTAIYLVIFLWMTKGYAQLEKITFDLQKDKPEKFQRRTLRSEKTGQNKFTLPTRIIQNTTSHYNFYFNAQTKLNQVIERARLSQIEDYTKILPYNSFSYDQTAEQKTELDSIIYKATAGILLHDLRSDWVDDFYLLIGQSYFLRKEFDSAAITFQFINYNLFPRKKNEDNQLIVGTNDNAAMGVTSVSSPENFSFFKKLTTRPPRRNDALVWQILTWTEMGEYSDAAALINTLKHDPIFPKRLEPFLAEVQGYWFYKQKMYDSAVIYIEKGLPNALDTEDRSRREFLLAQLYEKLGKNEVASVFYNKVMKHTTNPLMDIYANLNNAKLLTSNDPDELRESINQLVKMSKKYRFEPYRDVIFYAAGQLALQIPDTASTLSFLRASTVFNNKNLSLKNASFLQMAELNYQQRKYSEAYNYYDSIQLSDPTLKNPTAITDRKNALAKIVPYIRIIEREDSLQHIASLSEKEREELIKKLSKKLQKERGISDEEMEWQSTGGGFDNQNVGDLFFNNNAQGDWYFYNTTAKSKGIQDFIRNWGKRENVDNWRIIKGTSGNSLFSNVGKNKPTQVPKPTRKFSPSNNPDPMSEVVVEDMLDGEEILNTPLETNDISYNGLLANIPLTPEKMDTSNTKIALALFQLGKNYQTLLEDYYAAIETYEESLDRFPDSLYHGELWLNLSFCYAQIGNKSQADIYRNKLLTRFKDSKHADYLLHPEKMNPTKNNPAATARYEKIYELFIEGKFKEALQEKQNADSLYGNTYWNPQLLYIEAVYNVHQKNDSAAILVLNQIVNLYPKEPLREKAAIMIDVLKRRKSIENYLTNLQIKRVEEAPELMVFDDTKVITQKPKEQPVTTTLPPQEKKVEKKEIVINPEVKKPDPISNDAFSFDAFQPQMVVMVLDKVDPVYINEARNAFVRYNRENFYSAQLQITRDTLNSDKTLLLFSPFVAAETAIQFMDKIRKDAPREVSWLPAQKYSFLIISEKNLNILKANQKLEDYLKLLNEKYPGKF